MQGLYPIDFFSSPHVSSDILPYKNNSCLNSFETENSSTCDLYKYSPLTDCLLSGFKIAPISNPNRFCHEIKNNSSVSKLMNFYKGTTTLAFIYNNGLIVAVDSRASAGSFVADKFVNKVFNVNNKFLATMAGGAADCQYWIRVLNKLCRLYELRNGESISVAAASNLLTNSLFNYKGYGLSAGIMLCGYDNKGFQIYLHDENGMRIKGKMFSIGSGMVYAYGIIDSLYREDLTDEEAVELGRKAIYHATHRDGGSGNTATVYRIDKKGSHLIINQEDVNNIHHEYCKNKGKPTNTL